MCWSSQREPKWWTGGLFAIWLLSRDFFFFFHVRKMAPSELLSYRHLFIRPLPGWIIQNMLKVVLYLTYGNLKLHAPCRHISVYTNQMSYSKAQSCNLVGGAFSTWNINCSALCGSWCLHFWKSNCRIPCESSVLYGCSFLFPVCLSRHGGETAFIFVFNCMYLDVWGLSSFTEACELSSCGTRT